MISGCSARQAKAQFIGYTSPQTTQQQIYNAASCVGNITSPNVNNIGQTVHAITYSFSGSPTVPVIFIEGSNDNVNFFQISDAGTAGIGSGTTTGILIGYGYFPEERIHVMNGGTGCTMTVFYAGSSVTQPNPATGIVDSAAYQKTVFNVQPANASINSVAFQTPYGTSGGILLFSYTGSNGPSGSTLTLVCDGGQTVGVYAPGTAQGDQIFPVSAIGCSQVQVKYISGGASTGVITAIYYFAKPGVTPYPVCDKSFVINTAAAGPTSIITGVAGANIHICSVDVSSGTAEAVDFQQGTAAGCGTGNSQLTGLVHLAANTPFVRIYPNAALSTSVPGNSVCIHLSGANQTDGTITYNIGP